MIQQSSRRREERAPDIEQRPYADLTLLTGFRLVVWLLVLILFGLGLIVREYPFPCPVAEALRDLAFDLRFSLGLDPSGVFGERVSPIAGVRLSPEPGLFLGENVVQCWHVGIITHAPADLNRPTPRPVS